VKHYDWDELKNAQLKAERHVCFEDVWMAINENRVLDNTAHHDQIRYPHQRLLVVEINNYAYVVPYVEDNEKIFFKTIIPDRKATKKYMKGEK